MTEYENRQTALNDSAVATPQRLTPFLQAGYDEFTTAMLIEHPPRLKNLGVWRWPKNIGKIETCLLIKLKNVVFYIISFGRHVLLNVVD